MDRCMPLIYRLVCARARSRSQARVLCTAPRHCPDRSSRPNAPLPGTQRVFGGVLDAAGLWAWHLTVISDVGWRGLRGMIPWPIAEQRPQTKVTIVAKNEIYRWENLVGRSPVPIEIRLWSGGGE